MGEADTHQPNIKPQLTQVQVQDTENVYNKWRSREVSLSVRRSWDLQEGEEQPAGRRQKGKHSRPREQSVQMPDGGWWPGENEGLKARTDDDITTVHFVCPKSDEGASLMAQMVKNPSGMQIPGSGRPPGGEHGNPLQYSCLENSMDRGAWWATQSMGSQSWTRLSD